MSYPYPPLPYSSSRWSSSQDAQYKEILQLPPARPSVLLTYSGHSSTANIHSDVLTSRTEFFDWDEFDAKVQQARTDSMSKISSFSNDQMWTVMSGFVTAHGKLVQSSDITSEATASAIANSATYSVSGVYNRLDNKNTIVAESHRARLPSTIFRFGGSPQLDLAFLRSSTCVGAACHARDRLVAVEVKRPSIPLTSDAALPNNSTTVASKHNNGYSQNGKVWYVRMMSQAVIYALHTRNGCVVVTNHDRAMFMKVQPEQSDGIWKLKVKVSKLYKCNETYSSYHGIIAILRESVSGSDNTRNLQKAFNEIQGGRKPTTRSSQREASGSSTQRAPRRSKRSGSGAHGSSASNTVNRSLSSQDGGKAQSDNAVKRDVARFYQPELIVRLMETSDDIITTDGHSTVLRSWDGDMEVAVKYWNCASQDGLKMLLNEIEVYEEVASKHPHLLGTVLPRLIALWKEPATDAVVVTEHVGEALTRQEDGSGGNSVSLRIGNTVLDDDDYGLLEDATFKALDDIHSTGLRHRDVDIRNMRARREVDEGGVVRWRVWFIDLGLACYSGDEDDALRDEYGVRNACVGKAAT